ncbi:hypothetical protein [Paenibacillus arenilitoris]|uniref:Uncharacterized protein n=1 Tax=Paenibacillus arenilitoris TaxID=2772299 RepID=A0A927CMD0_9BACL|nr:hypothetical protein [Paenibacillus arenilitoris]MBD2869482.1 hypothetical protein [Paenibacillus arenilitoris]
MRFIEFLLNNIYIVVIVIGALASLFGRSSGKKRPRQMPNFGGGGLSGMPGRPERAPEKLEPDRPAGQTVYRSRSAEHETGVPEGEFAEHREVPSAAPVSPPAAAKRPYRRPVAMEADRAGTPAARSAGAQVRADDLRKAVLWAEILGPPRAKRPFRK